MNAARMTALALLSGSLLAAGCKGKPAPVKNADGSVTNPNGTVTYPANSPQAEQEQQQKGVLQSDGSYRNADGSVTFPAGSPAAQQEAQQSAAQQPASGEPAANQPATQPGEPAPAPAPVSLTVPRGTAIVVRINGELSSKQNEVGDRFTGVVDTPVRAHGETVFASGTPVAGEVVASKGKGRFKGAGDLGIELTAIGRETVHSSEYEKTEKGEGKRTGAFIGGGTGLGAIIGGLAGGGKGALIGGLAGAGAGTAGAATGGRNVVIPAESIVTFRLTEPVTR